VRRKDTGSIMTADKDQINGFLLSVSAKEMYINKVAA
jgi:hypothetical protein